MKIGITQHPKTGGLARRLGVCVAQAVGHLELLTHFTASYARRGDVGRWTDADIAEGCGWTGDPGEFIAALVETRWLDQCAENRLLLHDWADHAPEYVAKALKRKGESFAVCVSADAVQTTAERVRTVSGQSQTESGQRPDNGGTCPDSVRTESDSDRTQSRQEPILSTLPCPTMPSPTYSTPSAGQNPTAESVRTDTDGICPDTDGICPDADGVQEPVADGLRPPDPKDQPVMTFPVESGVWTLTESAVAEFRRTFRNPPWLELELDKARLWLVANPAKRKTARGMMRFLASWLSRAQENKETKLNGGTNGKHRFGEVDPNDPELCFS